MNGDAILDVYEQTAVVTAAWNARALVARNSKRKTGAVQALQADVSTEYKESKEELARLFETALIKGHDQQVLTELLIDRLPTAVLRDVMSELPSS